MNRTNKYGTMHNCRPMEGFNLTLLRNEGARSIFKFSLCYPNPLTWENERDFWQPNRNEITDLGSTPRFTWSLFPPTQFPLAYIFHDSCWKHGGLWFATRQTGIYTFMPLTRKEGNSLMWDHISLDNTGLTRRVIYSSVQVSRFWYSPSGEKARLLQSDVQGNPNKTPTPPKDSCAAKPPPSDNEVTYV